MDQPRIAIYARARTAHSLKAQKQACQRLAEQNGWEVVETFEDRHYPSASDRSEYRRMVEVIRAGEVQAVTAAEVASLSRSTQEINDLLDLCDEHGVVVRTADGQLDTSTAQGRYRGRVLMAMAEFEEESQDARRRRREAEAE